MQRKLRKSNVWYYTEGHLPEASYRRIHGGLTGKTFKRAEAIYLQKVLDDIWRTAAKEKIQGDCITRDEKLGHGVDYQLVLYVASTSEFRAHIKQIIEHVDKLYVDRAKSDGAESVKELGLWELYEESKEKFEGGKRGA